MTTPVHPAPAETREVIDFGGLQIAYDERVLRPRPWTTAQSAWAAEILADAPVGPVLELCSGVGHIGLLAVAHTDRRLVCVDRNPGACEQARLNAAANGLAGRVQVREGSMDDVLRDSERFAVVVADPPWVPSAEVARFPEDPVLAIDGGEDGLSVAWICVDTARGHLRPGGSLGLQLGTVEQVDLLDARLRDDDLAVTEVRRYDSGVLARLDLH